MAWIDFLGSARFSVFMYDRIPLSRQDEIAARLAHGQSVLASTLAREFNVSEDAIRRDLRNLAANGKCRRVYGGALPPTQKAQAPSPKLAQRADRMHGLARSAAGFVQPGEFVFLDGGGVNLALAEYLAQDVSLILATNSVEVAARVMERGDAPLFLVGGMVNPRLNACNDATAAAAVEAMNIDRCFLGECRVSAQDGVSVNDPSDATFKRMLLRRSKASVVVATAESCCERAPYRIATATEIDRLVVEYDLDAGRAEALAAAGFVLAK